MARQQQASVIFNGAFNLFVPHAMFMAPNCHFPGKDTTCVTIEQHVVYDCTLMQSMGPVAVHRPSGGCKRAR